mmetsp:Transcript_9529/g.32479  ORF Transcript_9529/g.32479 Transcript_9529/m.32479 type:complete len:222 (+) Transcript_9529:263-928(+)
MVPSFTTRGNCFPVASKWRSAAPVPPLPSQKRRPLAMYPVLRLSHRFSRSPPSSQRHSEGLLEMRLPLSSCARPSAYLDTGLSSSRTKVASSSCLRAPAWLRTASHARSTSSGSSGASGRNTGASPSTRASWYSSSTSNCASVLANPPSTPMPSSVTPSVGAASPSAGAGGAGLGTWVHFSKRYSVAPDLPWSMARKSAPTPIHVLRFTYSPESLKGLSKE